MNRKIQSIVDKLNDLKDRVRQADLKNDDLTNAVETAILEFEANRYLICAAGSVKAGKSTLVNALCQTKVAIDSSGAETTLKCSIIMASDELHPAGIRFYGMTSYPQESAPDETAEEKDPEKKRQQLRQLQKKSVDQLMCYFLGGKRSIPDSIQQSKRYDLNNHWLEALSADGHTVVTDCPHFFIAEIRVDVAPDGDSLLNEKIAILDLPGIDGLKGGREGNPYLEFIAERCHHVLLVQSSLSALNVTLVNSLTNLNVVHPNDPVFLVTNQMDAQEWKNEAARGSAQKDAIERSEIEIGKVLAISERCILNAAEAWSAYHDQPAQWMEKYHGRRVSKEQLIEESGIRDLIEKLKTASCGDNWSHTLQQHAHDSVVHLKKFQQSDACLGAEIQSLRQSIRSLDERRKELSRIVEFDWSDAERDLENKIAKICESFIRQQLKTWETGCIGSAAQRLLSDKDAKEKWNPKKALFEIRTALDSGDAPRWDAPDVVAGVAGKILPILQAHFDVEKLKTHYNVECPDDHLIDDGIDNHFDLSELPWQELFGMPDFYDALQKTKSFSWKDRWWFLIGCFYPIDAKKKFESVYHDYAERCNDRFEIATKRVATAVLALFRKKVTDLKIHENRMLKIDAVAAEKDEAENRLNALDAIAKEIDEIVELNASHKE